MENRDGMYNISEELIFTDKNPVEVLGILCVSSKDDVSSFCVAMSVKKLCYEYLYELLEAAAG